MANTLFILDGQNKAPGDAHIVRYNLAFMRYADRIQIGTITQDGKTIDVAGSKDPLSWKSIIRGEHA